MLYQLSYVGLGSAVRGGRRETEDDLQRFFSSHLQSFLVYPLPASVCRLMERETGIEPATNSLEGCDSTPELLPHSLTRQT